MLVYWHQGALRIEPESELERKALVTLCENAKFGRPQGKLIPAGASKLGSDELFEALVGDHQAGPRRFSGKTENNQPVFRIDEVVKVIA